MTRLPDRRHGWTTLPIICPRCVIHNEHPVRLKDPITATHGGALRCERCNALVWALVNLKVRSAYVVEVTHAELVYIDEHEMDLVGLFAYLGIDFPYAFRPPTVRQPSPCPP